MLTCKICHKQFNHLGSHIWHKHKMLAREYKKEFELPYKMSLITPEIKKKKRIKTLLNPTWKKNFSNSKQYQFKKGKTGLRRISEHERKTNIKRINAVNKRKKKLTLCPVCKMKFNHIESHLYNAHKLLMVK